MHLANYNPLKLRELQFLDYGPSYPSPFCWNIVTTWLGSSVFLIDLWSVQSWGMELTPLCYEHPVTNCAWHMFGAINVCGMKELQNNEVKKHGASD